MWYYTKYIKNGNKEDENPYFKRNRNYKAGWFNKRWELNSYFLKEKAVMASEYIEFIPTVITEKAVMATEYMEFIPTVITEKAVMATKYKEV